MLVWIGAVVAVLLVGVVVYDLTQQQTPSCEPSRSLATPAIGWRPSVPNCANTSSPTTTKSVHSAATSGGGSTPPPSGRTTTSVSAPTTRWSCSRTT